MTLFIPAAYRSSELGRVRRRDIGFRSESDGRILERIRPGVYASAADWARATPEGRVIARAHALALVSESLPILSHETAAALHGLALFRPDRARVHVTLADERPGSATGTIRHRGDIPDDEIVTVRGLRCTSLARTIADVARTASFERAVVIADAALRVLCVQGPASYDVDGARAFQAIAQGIAERFPRGRRRAERVLMFSDGRAQLPGESISRIRLAELGFQKVRLQVGLSGPHGRYYVDFALDDPGANAFGEFDGAVKYVDRAMLSGRSGFQALDDEKQREDWIRGTTQRSFARWGWPHIDTADALGRRLAAFGIRPL